MRRRCLSNIKDKDMKIKHPSIGVEIIGMKENKYLPQPIDTTDVKQPEELEVLVERWLKLIMKLGFKIDKE